MSELYPTNQKGCIVVHDYIQINENYDSLNESLNHKILSLCINFQVYSVVIVHYLKITRVHLCLEKDGGMLNFSRRKATIATVPGPHHGPTVASYCFSAV